MFNLLVFLIIQGSFSQKLILSKQKREIVDNAGTHFTVSGNYIEEKLWPNSSKFTNVKTGTWTVSIKDKITFRGNEIDIDVLILQANFDKDGKPEGIWTSYLTDGITASTYIRYEDGKEFSRSYRKDQTDYKEAIENGEIDLTSQALNVLKGYVIGESAESVKNRIDKEYNKNMKEAKKVERIAGGLDGEISDSEFEFTRLNQELVSNQTTIDSLPIDPSKSNNRRLSEIETRILALNAELDNENLRILDNNKTRLIDEKAAIEENIGKINAVDLEIANIITQITELDNTAPNYNTNKEDLKTKITELENSKISLGDLDTLRTQLNSTISSLENNQREIDDETRSLNTAQQANLNEKQRLEEEKANIQRYIALTNRNKLLSDTLIPNANKKLEELKNEQTRLRDEAERLKTRPDATKNNGSNLESESGNSE